MALSLRLLDIADGGGTLTVDAVDVVAGELLLCYVDTDVGGESAIGGAAGWTLVHSQPGNTGSRALKVFSLAEGVNGSYGFTVGSSADGTAAMIAVAGTGGTLAIDGAAGATGSALTAAPSVTTAEDNGLLLCYWIKWGNNQPVIVLNEPQMDVWLDNHQSGTWSRRVGASETIPTAGATGTRSVDEANAAISIAMSEAASGDVAGSGTVTAPTAQMSGMGSVTITGAGQVDAPAATVAGAGDVTVTGTGSVTAPAATIAGTGNIGTPAITGSGTVTAPTSATLGDGDVIVSGAGTVTATVPTFTGTASVVVTGAGTFTAPASVITGSEDPPPPVPDVLTLANATTPLTLSDVTDPLRLTSTTAHLTLRYVEDA